MSRIVMIYIYTYKGGGESCIYMPSAHLPNYFLEIPKSKNYHAGMYAFRLLIFTDKLSPSGRLY